MLGKPGLTVRPTLLSGVPSLPALRLSEGHLARRDEPGQCAEELACYRLEEFPDATGEALDVLVLERHDGRRGHANCGREIVLTGEEPSIVENPLGAR
jgi:hypothetical protein